MKWDKKNCFLKLIISQIPSFVQRYLNYIKSTQGFYYQDEKNYYNGSSMCEIQIRINDDIRVQKRTYRKMTDVFAITGGYMQLISTIFSVITFFS